MSDAISETTENVNNEVRISQLKTTQMNKQIEAKKALQDALNQSVDRIVGHLKAVGATEEELRAARPGLISAQLALGPVKTALDFIGITILSAVPILYFALADNPEFVRKGGFLLYPLFWMSNWSQALADATRYVLGLGAMLGASLILIYHNPLTRMRVVSGATLAQEAAKRSRRLATAQVAEKWSFFLSTILMLVFIPLLWFWSIAALSPGRGPTWWDGILVTLSAIWSLMICSFLFRRLPSIMEAILHHRFPGFALLNALSETLDIVRDRHLWFDVEHRFLAARELAKAANILEGPMLRRFVEETGDKGGVILKPRFADTAASLRKKLIWIATPMSGTREDLERFLKDAVIAAATGQVHRIGDDEVTNFETALAASQKWLTRLMMFVKSLVIATIPLALVWSALKFNLMPLSSEADRATAQNAALLWFVLSIMRTLDPGGFKEVSEASGGWTERLSRSLGKGSK